jgi:hypothetical protein
VVTSFHLVTGVVVNELWWRVPLGERHVVKRAKRKVSLPIGIQTSLQPNSNFSKHLHLSNPPTTPNPTNRSNWATQSTDYLKQLTIVPPILVRQFNAPTMSINWLSLSILLICLVFNRLDLLSFAIVGFRFTTFHLVLIRADVGFFWDLLGLYALFAVQAQHDDLL